MSKRFLIVVIIFLIVGAYFAYPQSSAKNIGVIAFGDSLTQGVGSDIRGGYVTLLSQMVDQPIENLGVSGNTTATALARVAEVAERKPAITIILLGGNDYLQKIPESETYENLGKIIESVETSGSQVLLVGLAPGYRELALRYQTGYVGNILDGISDNSNMLSDAIHPNTKGYRLMAERVSPELRRMLKRD